MSKKKDVTIDSLVKVKPITDNQKLVFEEYKKDRICSSMVLQAQVKLLYHCTSFATSSRFISHECVYLVRSGSY